jgi:hypothetical protein
VLLPTLSRDQGFLARTLRWRPAAMPAWLQDRRADGSIRIATLTAGAMEFKDVRAHVLWDAGDVELNAIEGKLEDAGVAGRIDIDVSGNQPRYRMRGGVEGFGWKGGKVGFNTRMETRGTGSDFLSNLHSEGSFQARGIALLPEGPMQTASGSYVFSIAALGPKIKLTAMQASMGSERFSGQGETQADGKIQVELASTSRVIRANGPIVPLRLDVVMARQ